MEDFYFEDNNVQEEGSLNLRRYWLAITHKWWLWSIITLVISIPWILYVKKEKPVYEAFATIQFRSFEGVDLGLLQSRIQKLTSRTFAEKVVEELGLVFKMDPLQELAPKTRREIFSHFSTSQHPVTGTYILRFFPDKTFSLYRKHKKGGQIEKIYSGSVAEAQVDTVHVNGFLFVLAQFDREPPSELEFNIANFRNSVKNFQNRIDVSYRPPGSLMKITLKDSDPYLAALMTNRLAEIFVRESRSVKDEKAKVQLQILKARLDKAEQDLEKSNKELTSFQQKNSINLDETAQKDNRDLELAEEKKERIERNKETIQILLNQAKQFAMQNTADGVSGISREQRSLFKEFVKLGVFADNAKMIILKTRLDELESRYAEVSKLSEANPKALKLAASLKDLHQQIIDVANEEIRSINREISELKITIRTLKAKLAQLPAKQMAYAELSRKNKKLGSIYQEVLQSYQKAEINAVAETEEIRILDPAIEPELPINSNKKVKALAGAIGAFFLGLFITLVIEFLNRSIKTVDDVKKFLRLNVLGSIPQVDFEDVFDFQDNEKIKMIDQQLVTHDYSPTPIGEAYRSLRTSIMFSKSVGRIQTLVVTSMAPGDGKSFTSANLAITMAQQKSNTLLVDTDLRRGVLHNTFGVAKEPGFSNYLSTSLPIPEILNETHIPNLSVISCGSLIPNPSELLGSHQMRRFLDEVRRRFDVVLFDTPPLNAATDAVVIGTQVDATVIVIRSGKTNRDMAKQKLELYQHVPAKVIGVILNGTTPDLAHEGYSYYHY